MYSIWLPKNQNGKYMVFDQSAFDYSIRMTQFFDYYLKRSPPPKWMSNRVPAQMKAKN